MSVIVHKHEEYGKIVSTIFHDRYSTYKELYRSVYTYADEREDKELFKTCDELTDAAEGHILYWIKRVYWANQLAHMLSYDDADRTMKDLPDNFHDQSSISHGELYKLLTGIEYNLVSNGGQRMISESDQNRLSRLIAACADYLIRKIDY